MALPLASAPAPALPFSSSLGFFSAGSAVGDGGGDAGGGEPATGAAEGEGEGGGGGRFWAGIWAAAAAAASGSRGEAARRGGRAGVATLGRGGAGTGVSPGLAFLRLLALRDVGAAGLGWWRVRVALAPGRRSALLYRVRVVWEGRDGDFGLRGCGAAGCSLVCRGGQGCRVPPAELRGRDANELLAVD